MNNAIHWYFGTQQAYLGLKTNNKLDPEGMYFITDTNEFYYKDVNYMNNTIYFTGDLPDIDYITPDHVYFNTTTLTAYTHDGTKWNVLIEPANVSVLLTPEDDSTNGVPQMVTGAAVKAYTDRYINTNNNPALVDISWDNVNSQIRFKRYIDKANLDPTALYINQFAASIKLPLVIFIFLLLMELLKFLRSILNLTIMLFLVCMIIMRKLLYSL